MKQGYFAEQDEFSILDNPYPHFSPEWIHWRLGFIESVERNRDVKLERGC